MANELKVTFRLAIPADCLLRSLLGVRVAIARRESGTGAVDGLTKQRANEASVYSAAAGARSAALL
jgi:hypothetical protein